VGLVDGEQRDADVLDRLAEPLVLEPLGGDVQEPQLPAADLLHHVAVLVCREGRIEPAGGDAARGQGIDLVLHQGDQRRDDERHAGQEQGRQLVAERLAAAGGKDGRGRAALHKVLHHRLLAGAELSISEVGLEGIGKLAHGAGLGSAA
jgi:hypothetical protein